MTLLRAYLRVFNNNNNFVFCYRIFFYIICMWNKLYFSISCTVGTAYSWHVNFLFSGNRKRIRTFFILYFLHTFLMEWGGRHNVHLLWRTSGLAELWMQPHLALHWPNYLGQLFNLYESVSNLREKVLFFFSFCHCMWWPHTNSAATSFDRHLKVIEMHINCD